MLELIPVCLRQLPSLNPFKRRTPIVLHQDGKVITSTRVGTNFPGEVVRQRTNINELYLVIWLFTNSHMCQFIEIVHKIINWYMKNPK